MTDTSSERKSDILAAILKLPLLPEKSQMADRAANEIVFSAHLSVPRTEAQHEKFQLTAKFQARKQIEQAISSMDTLITSLSSLEKVAVRAIDRQADQDVIADDIG